MINTNDLNQIVERIGKSFQPEKIILFGSYADGSQSVDSDVDLLVVAETTLSAPKRFRAVSKLLGEYPIAFDIIFKTPSEYKLQRNILNHIVFFADKYGKVIYGR